eukprot:COSAG02_NODE_59572_length_274_cov_0.565714_1_plen_46_part_01
MLHGCDERMYSFTTVWLSETISAQSANQRLHRCSRGEAIAASVQFF